MQTPPCVPNVHGPRPRVEGVWFRACSESLRLRSSVDNIKFAGSRALQDVKKGGHGKNGRPVGTRTPDLYRVKS
jgi:hypothetical protein